MIHKYARTDEDILRLEGMIELRQVIDKRSPVLDAMKYEVFNRPNNSSNGIAMWNGKHCALLSSKDNAEPYDFIEMVMRDMEEGDIVVLFSKADYEAAKRCDYHIKAKKLKVKLEN